MTADLAKLKEAAERAQGLLRRATGKRNLPQGDGERLAGFVFDGSACSTHDALSGPIFELEAMAECVRAVPGLLTRLSAANAAHASALARVAVLEGALAGAIAADDTLSRLAVAEGHLDKLADTLSRLLDGKRLTHEQAISTAIVNLARLVDRAALRTEGEGQAAILRAKEQGVGDE